RTKTSLLPSKVLTFNGLIIAAGDVFDFSSPFLFLPPRSIINTTGLLSTIIWYRWYEIIVLRNTILGGLALAFEKALNSGANNLAIVFVRLLACSKEFS